MAIYFYNLNTFKMVEDHYNNTKPIRTTGEVPLGDRARKWEQVVKVTKNKYVFLDFWRMTPDDQTIDGHYFWDRYVHECIKRPAMEWRKLRNGKERMRVYNGEGNNAHNSRYSFLYRATPRLFDFTVTNGKQYITMPDGSVQYLPKSTTLPKRIYDNLNETPWTRKKDYTGRCDGKYLEFERDPDTDKWSCVHGDHALPVRRTRIDIDAKKPYRNSIKEFAEWAWIVRDFIIPDIGDWKAMSEHRTKAQQYIRNSAEFRNVIADEQHEARIHVLADMINDMCSYDWSQGCHCITSDPAKFRAQLNTRINRLGGFNKHSVEMKEQ
jgi:hypothetical protein